MRFVKLAALTACLGLWASEANAYYFQQSGFKGDGTGVALTDLNQATPYYVQLESASLGGVGFLIHSRETLYFVGGDLDGQIADVFNVNTDMPYTVTSFGAVGILNFPQDSSDALYARTFDSFKFTFIPPNGIGDPDGIPWTLTVSDSPISAPSAVPEPAAWAMMIAGFGLVGSTLRRRRVLTF
jgi:hypothetical protein